MVYSKLMLSGLLFLGSKIDNNVAQMQQYDNTTTSLYTNSILNPIITSTTSSITQTSTIIRNYMQEINEYITKNKNFPISGVIKISNNSNLITIQTSSSINANTVKDVQAYLQKIVQPKRVNISVLKDKKIITIRIEFYNL